MILEAMDDAVRRQQASDNTKLHCLYGYYTLKLSKRELAHIYCKTEKTTYNWVRVYEERSSFDRARHVIATKYTPKHRQWLVRYF